ncbi:hypothetical protein B0H13DRAFT_2674749 [Mycena leptocephala]|nr:hypothetical protein B0H13DRAFT_2674749 [Mycena leptocephala]
MSGLEQNQSYPPQKQTNKHQRYYEKNKEKILAKLKEKRTLAKAAKANEISFVDETNGSSEDDASDSSYKPHSDTSHRGSDSDSDISDSTTSHASSDAEPLHGIQAVFRRFRSKVPAMERLAIIAQDADLWAAKWGGIPNWLALDYSEELVIHLDIHRDRGRQIVDDVFDFSYATDLPTESVWLQRILQKSLSISNVVHGGIEALSILVMHWRDEYLLDEQDDGMDEDSTISDN